MRIPGVCKPQTTQNILTKLIQFSLSSFACSAYFAVQFS
jgi:hypothetical protein